MSSRMFSQQAKSVKRFFRKISNFSHVQNITSYIITLTKDDEGVTVHIHLSICFAEVKNIDTKQSNKTKNQNSKSKRQDYNMKKGDTNDRTT